ncbi:MAG: hypothetical protein JXR12_15255 [Neptunomonas phycophila]|uniref:hypothetical protein n=1 Tax=Neptunomonas phycophila TaxID=1572645 RepID=UPI003B8D1EC7
MQNQQLMDPKEWQRLSLPIEVLYGQLNILNSRMEVAQGMNKPEMIAGIQGGIDRLNKIIAFRLAHDNQENKPQ